MFIDCTRCHHGRIVEEGFDGRTARECPDCHGLGEIELTREEEALMLAFLDDCAASLEGAATVAAVETFLGDVHDANTLPAPIIPGMTFAFWDAAVETAFDAGLSISGTGTPGTVAVSSGTDDDTYYHVTLRHVTASAAPSWAAVTTAPSTAWYCWVEACDAVAAVQVPELVAA